MISCQSKILHKTVMDNTLTTKEKNEGWKLLFDGRTMNGWRPYLHNTTATWVVEDGTLKGLGKGSDSTGYIISEDQFENFELKLEWKIAPRGNSGILYMVVEDPAYKTPYETGPEYQVIDDLGWPDPLEEWQKTGANYAMHVAQNKELKPVGEWNYEEVIIQGTKITITLNGTLIVDGDIAGPRDNGTMDHNEHPGLKNKTGHIGFLGHGSELKFRNIRIKDLSI